MDVLQGMQAAAPAAAPAWEDESGLEDLDLDQLVSQHRSRLSPPVLPEPQTSPLPEHHNIPQRTVRPAAAAAAAVVKSSVLPTLTPPVLPQHQPLPTQAPSAFANSETAAAQYGSTLDLQGVKERLLEVAEQLLDGNVAGQQAGMLQQERKHLQELRAKLEAELQYGRPPPDPNTGPASAFQGPAQRAPSTAAAAPVSMPYVQDPGHQQAQASSWQPSTARQHLPMTNQRAAAPSNDNWDTGAASGPASSSWGQQGAGPQSHQGSGSFAYDAPGPAPREDMAMAEPDPSLRRGAEPEGFVSCHQHDGLVDKRWDKTFEWSAEMQHVLEKNFGTKTFRANQRQAINASLAGKDVFVLMPTGGGMLRLSDHSAWCNRNAHYTSDSTFMRQCNTLHCIAMHSSALLCSSLRCTTLHYIGLCFTIDIGAAMRSLVDSKMRLFLIDSISNWKPP